MYSIRVAREQLAGFVDALRRVVVSMQPEMSREQVSGSLTAGELDPEPVNIKLLEACLVGTRKFPAHKIPQLENLAAGVLRRRGQMNVEEAYALLHWHAAECNHVCAPIEASGTSLEETSEVIQRFARYLDRIAKAQDPRSPKGVQVTEEEDLAIQSAGWDVLRAVYGVMTHARRGGFRVGVEERRPEAM